MQDDSALDIRGEYMKQFHGGKSTEEILRRVKAECAWALGDSDEEPVFWLAVAACQWECGHLSAAVLGRVRRIVERGLGLERWAEEGPKKLARRRARLAAFLEAIEKPNPKPRKPKPAIKRAPVFSPGDCLAIRRKVGRYAALLVLDAEPESSEPGVETVGENVVGELVYDSDAKPGLAVFEARRWAPLRFPAWTGGHPAWEILSVGKRGYLKVRDRIEVVGRIAIRKSDPREPLGFTDWQGLVDMVGYGHAT